MKKENIEKALDQVSDMHGVTKVEDGGCTLINSSIAFNLLKNTIILNGHFCKDFLPGMGFAAGRIFTYEEKDYLAIKHEVGIANQLNLHLGRKYEKLFIEWKKSKLSSEIKELNVLIVSSYSEYLGKLDWYDYAGFDCVGTPSQNYFDLLSRIKVKKSIRQKVDSLLDKIQPYVGIGPKLKEIRDLLDSKGVIRVDKRYVSTSSPSASGGADWYLSVISENEEERTSGNNLMFLLMNSPSVSRLNHFGGGDYKYGLWQLNIKDSLLIKIDNELQECLTDYKFIDPSKESLSIIYDEFIIFQKTYKEKLEEILDRFLPEYLEKNSIGTQFEIIDTNLIYREIKSSSQSTINIKEVLIETDKGYHKLN